jgi:uncharacterized protein (TIGR00251 family)
LVGRRRGGKTIKIHVKVIPSSSRDAIAGWLGEALKVRVSAPPERGRANSAVESVVAAALGVPSNCVRVVSGHASPRKVLEISGVSESEVYARLSKPETE